MALPLLPGNSFNHNLGKTKFHKSHHFDYNNSVGQDVGEVKPGIGGERRLLQKDAAKNSSIPQGDGTALPSWVAFDKQVLSFEAFFMESGSEGGTEGYKVHQCRVFFYLEDDTMQICEPKQNNSGTMQGTIVRRHRIPKPRGDQFYVVDDLNNGNELEIYGRVYKLVDCDQFTKNFLRKLGVKLNPSQSPPSDPYMQRRQMIDSSMQPLRPYERKNTMKKFLENDGKVLRFYCFWDDRANKFGDPREMVLLYHLADDTIEVVEILPQNSGRDATPMFLKKGKLPKVLEPMRRPGELADRTVLNVFADNGGRYLLDNLKIGEVNQDFYEAKDLRIGNFVNVWGRQFLICDCDESTKQYYRDQFGIYDFSPLRVNPAALEGTKCHSTTEERPSPPYNGFGSHEDSMASVLNLIPKPPKKDFIKFINNDTNTLRYLAKMTDSDEERIFVICYFLADDTVQVFEKNPKNSGQTGGRFLERTRPRRPTNDLFDQSRPSFYLATDFYAGSLVELNRQKFMVIDADEYTYNYMEENISSFPQSDIRAILQKVVSYVSQGRGIDCRSDVISVDEFFSLLNDVTADQLTVQELVTVARYYQDRKDEVMSEDALVSVVQNQLRKTNFDDFKALEEQCYHFDVNRVGRITADRFRLILKTLRTNVADDVLRTFLNRLKSTVDGQIDYQEVIHLINYKSHKVSTPVLAASRLEEQGWQGNKSRTQVQLINMKAFVSDVVPQTYD